MQVTLIAHTSLTVEGFVPGKNEFNLDPVTERWMLTDDEEPGSADTLAEFAGRSCYQSFHKPNPKTAANADYLANILNQGHESVLEHASATFYVQGVSRALTHELIRHRHLSYSELSQRFVNVTDAEVVTPPALRDNLSAVNLNATNDVFEAYVNIVEDLQGQGLPRKQAREAARSVLPNATETRIVVTGNMRSWLDVLRKRWHVAADAEIREFSGEVLRQLRQIAPGTFSDIPNEPYGSDES